MIDRKKIGSPRLACVVRKVGAFTNKGVLRAGIVLAALLFALSPPVASAAIQADMGFPHALTPAFRWSEPIQMHLSGVPVQVRGFVATLTLEQAARAMSQHHSRFQRVTTLPGSILLSGVHKGHHWVAQLEAAQGQVRGMVSALPMGLDTAEKANEPTDFLAPWLTQNARFVFGQSFSGIGRGEAQTIHVPKRPLNEFIGALDRRLVQAGWQRRGVHSWRAAAPMGPTGSRRIDIFPVRNSAVGAAVLINQAE